MNLKNEIGVENNAALSKQTLDYMINWLTNHIRTMDVVMGNVNEL